MILTTAAFIPLIQKAQAADQATAQVANTATSGFYQQLVELRSQNAVLTEALKNAKLKNEISAASNAIPSVVGGPSGYPTVTGPFTGSQATGPQVQMVSGTGNQLIAVISLASGGCMNVRVGSPIVGLGTVKSISRDEVIVASKTQTVSLPFAGEAAGSVGQPLPSSPGNGPMPMGMMPGGVR